MPVPELPEVETVVHGLRQAIVGKTIKSVVNRAPALSVVVSRKLGRDSLAKALTGRRINSIDRRGKNILIRLSGEMTLWVHLKMTGHFNWVERSTPVAKHDIVVFDLSEGRKLSKQQLRFHDTRRFGRLHLFYDSELMEQDGLSKLGPEPLEITVDHFVDLCRNKHGMIKPALLDQTFLAGLGNIYADETLHLARIHPQRIASSLSRRKLVELHGHIQTMLKRAIRLMGTTFDTFEGVNGRPGRFQKYLLVYGHEGEQCSFCGRPIVREKIGSRSAHFCPRCQRER